MGGFPATVRQRQRMRRELMSAWQGGVSQTAALGPAAFAVSIDDVSDKFQVNTEKCLYDNYN